MPEVNEEIRQANRDFDEWARENGWYDAYTRAVGPGATHFRLVIRSVHERAVAGEWRNYRSENFARWLISTRRAAQYGSSSLGGKANYIAEWLEWLRELEAGGDGNDNVRPAGEPGTGTTTVYANSTTGIGGINFAGIVGLRATTRIVFEEAAKDTPKETIPKNLAVLLGGDTVCVIRAEDKDKYESELQHLNRWTHEGGGYVRFLPTSSEPTDPYQRGWSVHWHTGRAGYDVIPEANYGDGSFERLVANSSNELSAVVLAPSALLAIERAKFLAGTVRRGKT